ncbi:unnamed protein product [Rotaria socialis]
MKIIAKTNFNRTILIWLFERILCVYVAALILGGVNDQSHFKNPQKLTNKILYTGVRSDDENESIHYKQLLKNILYNNVCFNLPSEIPKITGESNIDLIVDKDFENGNSVIIVAQHVIKFAISDVILGVLIIQIKSNSRYFMIDVSQIENNQNKEEKELNYLVTMINHFCSSATDLGAVEVEGDLALRLLSDAKAMLRKTTTDLKRQINLDDFDE